MLAQWLSPMLYRRSPPTSAPAAPGRGRLRCGHDCRGLQRLLFRRAARIDRDAGDEQGGSASSGYSGTNGGTGSIYGSGTTSGSGGNGGTGSSGGQMLLDAAGDAIEASASDAAADVADVSADAATPEGGSE